MINKIRDCFSSVLLKFLTVFLFTSSLAFAQYHSGLVPVNPQLYRSLPQGVYSLRNTGVLPVQVDLSNQVLVSLSQGTIGSCASWAVAYEFARLERTRNRWPITENNMFSASYLYNQVNEGLNKGTSFFDNLSLAVEKGCSTYSTFPYTLNYRLQPDERAHAEAAHYRVHEWKTIDKSIESYKSWLAGGYGIITSFIMWDNFDYYRSGVYRPAGQRGVLRDGVRSNYHGCLIVGYDDNLRRFKVINSWGSRWGENGYFYFDYDDIDRIVRESYIMTPRSKLNPPAGLEASRGVYRDRIILTWNKDSDIAEYLVFRLEENQYRLLGRSTTGRFEDRSAERGREYFYYVASMAGNTMSEYSSPVEGWIRDKAEPGIPQNLLVVQIDNGVLLSWEAAEDAAHYEIYRWEEGAEAFILTGNTQSTLFLDQEITGHDRLAAYIVVAVNQYGSSLPSNLSYAILDSDFRKRNREDHWFNRRRYSGEFYQFPVERYSLIEGQVESYYGRSESRIESYFNNVERNLNNYFRR